MYWHNLLPGNRNIYIKPICSELLLIIIVRFDTILLLLFGQKCKYDFSVCSVMCNNPKEIVNTISIDLVER